MTLKNPFTLLWLTLALVFVNCTLHAAQSVPTPTTLLVIFAAPTDMAIKSCAPRINTSLAQYCVNYAVQYNGLKSMSYVTAEVKSSYLGAIEKLATHNPEMKITSLAYKPTAEYRPTATVTVIVTGVRK